MCKSPGIRWDPVKFVCLSVCCLYINYFVIEILRLKNTINSRVAFIIVSISYLSSLHDNNIQCIVFIFFFVCWSYDCIFIFIWLNMLNFSAHFSANVLIIYTYRRKKPFSFDLIGCEKRVECPSFKKSKTICICCILKMRFLVCVSKMLCLKPFD